MIACGCTVGVLVVTGLRATWPYFMLSEFSNIFLSLWHQTPPEMEITLDTGHPQVWTQVSGGRDYTFVKSRKYCELHFREITKVEKCLNIELHSAFCSAKYLGPTRHLKGPGLCAITQTRRVTHNFLDS